MTVTGKDEFRRHVNDELAELVTEPTDERREEMRRSMMENANREAAEAKEKVIDFIRGRVNLLERENRTLKADNTLFRNIIERLLEP